MKFSRNGKRDDGKRKKEGKNGGEETRKVCKKWYIGIVMKALF